MDNRYLDSHIALDRFQRNTHAAFSEALQAGIPIVTGFGAVYPYGAKRGSKHPVYISLSKDDFPFSMTTDLILSNKYDLYAKFKKFLASTQLLNHEGDLLLRTPVQIQKDAVEQLKQETDDSYHTTGVVRNLRSTLRKLQNLSGSQPSEEIYDYSPVGYNDDRDYFKNSRFALITEKMPLAVLQAAIDAYIAEARKQVVAHDINICSKVSIGYHRGQLSRLELQVPPKYFPFTKMTEAGGMSIHGNGFDKLTVLADLTTLLVFSSIPFSQRKIVLGDKPSTHGKRLILDYLSNSAMVDLINSQQSKNGRDRDTIEFLQELYRQVTTI